MHTCRTSLVSILMEVGTTVTFLHVRRRRRRRAGTHNSAIKRSLSQRGSSLHWFRLMERRGGRLEDRKCILFLH